jgi:hypothetical protein
MKVKKVDQRKLCEGWLKAPIGTDVCVTKDNGSEVMTKTRSIPWMLGEIAVIKVEGISGGYRLDRMRQVEL